MAKFLFVYRSGKDSRSTMTPEQMQQIITEVAHLDRRGAPEGLDARSR
jgi:hypothetical protein